MPEAERQIDRDAGLLRDAVRSAGALALGFFGDAPEQWTKHDETPVSEADLAVDAHLKERLADARPDYAWLSEESVDDPSRHDARRVWIVDPIDGTRSFLKGHDHWVISAALVEDGRPVLGAVFNPVMDAFYEARAGAGATLNGQPISVSRRSTIDDCRMVGYASLFKSSRWASPWPPMRVEMRNSMAYRMALVADGSQDATLTVTRKHDWDLAAAHLLVQEAGGVVTAHDGRPLVYNRPTPRHGSVLAAGRELHAALLERTRAYQAA